MNGSRVPLVFICGPFTEALNGQELDGDLRDFLELVFSTLERAKMSVVSAHRAERWGDDELPAEIIGRRDRDWMKACDATVMVLGTPSKPTWRTDGTFVEVGWATALEKPIVLVGDLNAYRSPLVRGLPGLSENIQTLSAQEVQADPGILLSALSP